MRDTHILHAPSSTVTGKTATSVSIPPRANLREDSTASQSIGLDGGKMVPLPDTTLEDSEGSEPATQQVNNNFFCLHHSSSPCLYRCLLRLHRHHLSSGLPFPPHRSRTNVQRRPTLRASLACCAILSGNSLIALLVTICYNIVELVRTCYILVMLYQTIPLPHCDLMQPTSFAKNT